VGWQKSPAKRGYERGAIFLPCLFWLLFLTKKKSDKS